MTCPVTILHLFTETKFKQELNTQNINTKQLKKHLISMVVDGGRALCAKSLIAIGINATVKINYSLVHFWPVRKAGSGKIHYDW